MYILSHGMPKLTNSAVLFYIHPTILVKANNLSTIHLLNQTPKILGKFSKFPDSLDFFLFLKAQ
jgi:hypothetical protein